MAKIILFLLFLILIIEVNTGFGKHVQSVEDLKDEINPLILALSQGHHSAPLQPPDNTGINPDETWVNQIDTYDVNNDQICSDEEPFNCMEPTQAYSVDAVNNLQFVFPFKDQIITEKSKWMKKFTENFHDSENTRDKWHRKAPSFVINWENTVKYFKENALFFLPLPSIDMANKDIKGGDEIFSKDADKAEDESDYENEYSFVPQDVHWDNLTDLVRPSEECGRDVRTMQAAFDNDRLELNNTWTLKMVDAWGKSRDEQMVGRESLGSFKQCLDVTVEYPNYFTGQYCLVITGTNGVPMGLIPHHYGTCIPSSCTEDELKISLNNQLGLFNHKAKKVQCQQGDQPLPSGSWVIVGCTVVGLMLFIVALGTAMQLFLKDKCPPMLRAFSAVDNVTKIMAVKVNDPKEISCFHGIRVLSICWVLLGHQYFFMVAFISNKYELPDIISPWPVQMIWNGYRAVDTFFIVGGLLMTRGLLAMDFCITNKKQTTGGEENNNNSNNSSGFINRQLIMSIQAQAAKTTIVRFVSSYVYLIFHRIVRILPAVLLIVMLCAGPSEWVVSGPYYKAYIEDYLDSCRRNWWFDLTFFSNIIFVVKGEAWMADPENAPSNGSCAGQSWYLGVDFQLYLVAPLLILPMKLFKHKVSYLSLLVLISCLIPGIIVVANDYMPAMLYTINSRATTDYFYYVYMMPYCRSTPFFVGAACGILIDRVKKQETDARWFSWLSNKVVLVIGWLLCTASILLVLFCLEDVNQLHLPIKSIHRMSKFAEFLYAGFAIAVWSLAMAWIIFVCTIGKGGPVNTFLSHPMWQPLSRVTFSVFLVSMPMQFMIFYSIKQYIYMSHITVFLSCGGVIIVSYLAAFVISVVAEAPYITLLKIMKQK